MTIKIESGIPVPRSYPFAQMQVGDSFALDAHMKRMSVYIAAKRFGDLIGWKFAVRKTPEGVMRCWRIE